MRTDLDVLIALLSGISYGLTIPIILEALTWL